MFTHHAPANHRKNTAASSPPTASGARRLASALSAIGDIAWGIPLSAQPPTQRHTAPHRTLRGLPRDPRGGWSPQGRPAPTPTPEPRDHRWRLLTPLDTLSGQGAVTTSSPSTVPKSLVSSVTTGSLNTSPVAATTASASPSVGFVSLAMCCPSITPVCWWSRPTRQPACLPRVLRSLGRSGAPAILPNADVEFL